MSARKSQYKSPPAAAPSQEARRIKALEEQKRRRAEKFDSARALDIFSNLNIGAGAESDEDNENGQPPPDQAVAPYINFIQSSSIPEETMAIENTAPVPESPTEFRGKANGKKKRHNKNKRKNNKPNRWADTCMYAEILEMNEDDSSTAWSGDGLPKDLENGWVAVAPVPVGKRCVAVTHESAGLAGILPNTILHSRLLGKSLMPPFPSTLPPQTILDCILDPNWRDNGLVHVLDVIKWKTQDIGDCETPFRMWWRDTRIAELPRSQPPASIKHTDAQTSSSTYQFPYPITFSPIPYHTNTTLRHLYTHIIPLARSSRLIDIQLPNPAASETDGMTMDVDSLTRVQPLSSTVTSQAQLAPDGLLLYVSQAAYEPGTSPLSSWVPINGYERGTEADEKMDADIDTQSQSVDSCVGGPLGLFERLVKRRLDRGESTA